MEAIAFSPLSTEEQGAEAPAARPARLPFIDGLRGLAVLLVLSYHGWIRTIHAPIRGPGRLRGLDLTAPLHFGYVGVHLFLLLSGFCLTYPLARRGKLRVEPGPFFCRRAGRILPPYYVALAGFALAQAARHARGVGEGIAAGNLLAHLLMLYNLTPRWSAAINGSFWSLALECQLYLLFPLLLWGVRRWGVRPALGAVLALTLGYRTWVYVAGVGLPMGQRVLAANAPPGRLFEFALGMAAALILARPDAMAWAARRSLPAAAAGLGLLALFLSHHWPPYFPVTDAVWGMAFFCWLIHAGRRSTAGRSWLEWRPLQRLGLFSYSVYLIHEPLLRGAAALLRPRLPSPTATLLLFELGVLPLLIGAGWVFYRVVEAPCLAIGKSPGPRTSSPPRQRRVEGE